MDYDIFFSEPVIPLEKKRSPVFKGGTLFNLKPFDRISLWVVMHPNRNMDTTRTSFEADPPSDSLQDLAASRTTVESSYRLAFYDQHSGKRVLAIPFLFKPMEAPHEAIAASR